MNKTFFLTFNRDDFYGKTDNICELFRDVPRFEIEASSLTELFRKIEINKSPGPESVSG